jgi:hypothetical protein
MNQRQSLSFQDKLKRFSTDNEENTGKTSKKKPKDLEVSEKVSIFASSEHEFRLSG